MLRGRSGLLGPPLFRDCFWPAPRGRGLTVLTPPLGDLTLTVHNLGTQAPGNSGSGARSGSQRRCTRSTPGARRARCREPDPKSPLWRCSPGLLPSLPQPFPAPLSKLRKGFTPPEQTGCLLSEKGTAKMHTSARPSCTVKPQVQARWPGPRWGAARARGQGPGARGQGPGGVAAGTMVPCPRPMLVPDHGTNIQHLFARKPSRDG